MNGCETEWKKTLEGGGRGVEEGESKRREKKGAGEEREEESKSG